MAERKSGPVKPPVIDLKAKPAPRSPRPKPEQAAQPEMVAEADVATADEAAPNPALASGPEASAAPEPPPRSEPIPPPAAEEPRPVPPPPRPPARLAMPWSAISIAAVVGALLGTGLTYLLVNWVPLRDNRPAVTDPTVRLDELNQGIFSLGQRFVANDLKTGEIETRLAQIDAGLAEVRQGLAAVPAAAPAVDLAPLETQLSTLEARVTAIGAGASSADATALAATLSGIDGALEEIRAQIAALEQRGGATDSAISALQGEVDTAQTAISSQTSGGDIGPAVRLPLLISGFEGALANGRPYAAELASLATLLPDVAVPQPVSSAAETGLPRPDAVAVRFSAAVPDILAGRSATPNGDWGADAMEWMKGLLALRPAEEIEGDAPEAVVSRLEGAIGRRDFATAATLLGQLPEAMRTAVGPLGSDIAALAAADGFVAELRARALGPAAEAGQ